MNRFRDTLEYHIYIDSLPVDASNDENVYDVDIQRTQVPLSRDADGLESEEVSIEQYLGTQIGTIAHTLRPLLSAYCWSDESFSLQIFDNRASERDDASSTLQGSRDKQVQFPTVPHIYGRMSVYRSLTDEWLLMYALLRVSARFPSLSILLQENGLQFLFHQFPEELASYNRDHSPLRMWIRAGHLLGIPCTVHLPNPSYALHYVQHNAMACVLPQHIHRSISSALIAAPESLLSANSVSIPICVSLQVAKVLQAFPQLLPYICRSIESHSVNIISEELTAGSFVMFPVMLAQTQVVLLSTTTKPIPRSYIKCLPSSLPSHVVSSVKQEKRTFCRPDDILDSALHSRLESGLYSSADCVLVNKWAHEIPEIVDALPDADYALQRSIRFGALLTLGLDALIQSSSILKTKKSLPIKTNNLAELKPTMLRQAPVRHDGLFMEWNKAEKEVPQFITAISQTNQDDADNNNTSRVCPQALQFEQSITSSTQEEHAARLLQERKAHYYIPYSLPEIKHIVRWLLRQSVDTCNVLGTHTALHLRSNSITTYSQWTYMLCVLACPKYSHTPVYTSLEWMNVLLSKDNSTADSVGPYPLNETVFTEVPLMKSHYNKDFLPFLTLLNIIQGKLAQKAVRVYSKEVNYIDLPHWRAQYTPYIYKNNQNTTKSTTSSTSLSNKSVLSAVLVDTEEHSTLDSTNNNDTDKNDISAAYAMFQEKFKPHAQQLVKPDDLAQTERDTLLIKEFSSENIKSLMARQDSFMNFESDYTGIDYVHERAVDDNVYSDNDDGDDNSTAQAVEQESQEMNDLYTLLTMFHFSKDDAIVSHDEKDALASIRDIGIDPVKLRRLKDVDCEEHVQRLIDEDKDLEDCDDDEQDDSNSNEQTYKTYEEALGLSSIDKFEKDIQTQFNKLLDENDSDNDEYGINDSGDNDGQEQKKSMVQQLTIDEVKEIMKKQKTSSNTATASNRKNLRFESTEAIVPNTEDDNILHDIQPMHHPQISLQDIMCAYEDELQKDLFSQDKELLWNDMVQDETNSNDADDTNEDGVSTTINREQQQEMLILQEVMQYAEHQDDQNPYALLFDAADIQIDLNHE